MKGASPRVIPISIGRHRQSSVELQDFVGPDVSAEAHHQSGNLALPRSSVAHITNLSFHDQ